MSRLAIGTVQFGMDYGVSNRLGQTTPSQVVKILELAHKNNIKTLDTAASYGNSEEILGRKLGDFDWDIVLKTPHFNGEKSTEKLLNECFHKSLRLLGRDNSYALLIHNCNDLFNPYGEKLFKEMEKLRSLGLIDKIGVSVYTVDQIDFLLNNFSIDIIQVPVNIFDQRLVSSGKLKELKKKGVEIHARSVFLQGLLLMPIGSIPSYFLPIKDAFNRLSDKANELSLSKLELTLGYVLGIKEIDKVIVGVNTVNQLKQIIAAENINININISKLNKISVKNPLFIDPICWKI